ncbi:MAG: nitroreductase family protein [Dehalococcoidia bacterium]
MDVLEAIKDRRSIRKYKRLPVSEEQVTQILEAGRWAPSRGNSQPWKFITLKNAQTLMGLAEAIPTGRFIAEAPLAIAVVINPKVSKHPEQDGAAATQNMLLATHALGLGACWISIHDTGCEEKAKQLLQIPDEEWLLSIVSIGHPAEMPEKERRGLDEITFLDNYRLR